jgi:hypothetical protein
MMITMMNTASSTIPIQGMLLPSVNNTLACSGSNKSGIPTGTAEALPRTTLADLDTFDAQTNLQPQASQTRSGASHIFSQSLGYLFFAAAGGVTALILSNPTLRESMMNALKGLVNGFGKKDTAETDPKQSEITSEATKVAGQKHERLAF